LVLNSQINSNEAVERMSQEIDIIDPVSDPRWDRFVDKHELGRLYHRAGWKLFLENSFPHMKGYYLSLLGRDGEEIVAGLPVYLVQSWIMGKKLVSIPYATLCDPLIETPEQWRRLANAALELGDRFGVDHLEIRTLRSTCMQGDERFVENCFYKHHYLETTEEPEQLKRRFHRTCVRQRISRAQKSDMHLITVETEEGLQRFFKLYVLTRKRKGLPPQPYVLFRNLWHTFHPSFHLNLFLAEYQGQAVGGVILLKYKDRVSVEYAVSDEKFRQMSPNHFLFWESIKLAHRQGYRVFDFGRTAPTNHSLMDFKNRWGTTVVDMPDYYYPKDRGFQVEGKEQSLKYKGVQGICKYAPLWMVRGLGKFCYRHLG